MIIRGELAPGERIVEKALSERVRVSRTPLREALKILDLEGLVEISQHRGARITPFTPGEAHDLFEVIAGLESLAAELAVERIGSGGLARLEEMHARMTAHFRAGEKDPYFDINSAIHEAVVEASGNPILRSTHATLMLRAKRGRYMAIMDSGRWQQAMDEHEALMGAFRRRDPVAAREVWRVHLVHTGQAVGAVLAALAGPDEATSDGRAG